ncbi:hypothetical protein Bca4012_002409 [Brassica carinata]|uniref:DYW domain-containing protein n=1 Tax=Brassica carinata TaxID=52824 RepID=A0A8X7RXF1_BRACI|nr:hypothetical protein Bca52824_042834 [Brassica carinata]
MMKLKGYKPETASLLQEMDDEEKESDLVQHSVKLAVAYALIILPEGIPIGIIKNREITLRDGSRFHHFSDGKCSCADYCEDTFQIKNATVSKDSLPVATTITPLVMAQP